MASRRAKKPTAERADDAEVLHSAFKELSEMIDNKHIQLSQLMFNLLEKKQDLEKQVGQLKEELSRSHLELQNYKQTHEQGTRVQKYKDKLQQSMRETEWYKKELEKSQKTAQHYGTILQQAESNLQQQLEAMSAKERELLEWERKLQYHEKELALREKPKSKDDEKLKQSSEEKKTKQIRRRSSSVGRISRSPAKVQYGVIRPGSITHDTIQQSFIEYYTKYRRQHVGTMLIEYKKHHATILTHIIQIAFEKSKEKILELIRQTIDKQKTDEVLKAVSLLRKSSLSASFVADTKEMEALLSTPIYTVDYTGSPEGWEEKKYAYSILLNNSMFDNNDKLAMLNKEVLQDVTKNFTKNPDIVDVVKKAVHLSWNMVTLVPPAIVAQPTEYHDEWHDKRYSSWNEDASDQMLNYYRPVLFYSTLGHVACKGEVGNILPANTEISGCQQVPRPSRSRGPLKAHTYNPCVSDKLAISYGMKQH